MSFEIEGKLHKKFDTENKTDTFQTREFVIVTDGTYPQFVKFQLTQDRCGIVEGFNENDKVKVYFDLRGREWNEKFFTNLNAWKIEKGASEQPSEPTQVPEMAANNSAVDPFDFPSEEPKQEDSEFDDLPF